MQTFLVSMALVLPASRHDRAGEVKLDLRPAMVINETGFGDAALLVDEQAAVGDPPTAAARPLRAYFAGWKDWMYPAHLIVDLGPGQRATRLAFFNETGRNSIGVSIGQPTRWEAARPLALDRYRDWSAIALDRASRYIRITLDAPVALPELVAYGERTEAGPDAEVALGSARRGPRPTFDQFLGVNAFIDDPIDRLVPVSGTLREYHNIGWDFEHPDRRLRFQPSGAAGGNLWFFDDYYKKLHEGGVTVAPCVQQSLPWITGDPEADAKPVSKGTDPADPASYTAHAAHLFQFAARYGATRVPDDQLRLAPGQSRSSGLGLIRYLEVGNEPDKDWKGRACLSTPFELAAQLSADYDGHRGALGAGHGLRAADPHMKLVMAGLYRAPLAYLDAIHFWSEHHRAGSFPADVVNFHVYCGDGDAQQAFKTRGISPEAAELRDRVGAVVAWRDQHAPAAEVWVSEFGYDVHPGSPLHAPALGALDAETVQAAWLARGALLMAAAGVDRLTMFMFRDVDSKAAGVFATSGLVGAKGDWSPKPSWYAQATLRSRLAGMTYDAELDLGDDRLIAFRFARADAQAIALWCRTSADLRVPGVRIPVKASRARLIELADGEPAGRVRDVEIRDESVTLELSEVPSLLILTP